MSNKDDLLQLAESQITGDIWDTGENEYWEEVLQEELRAADKAGQPLGNISRFAGPCAILAALARPAVARLTLQDPEDFETVSDCLHGKQAATLCGSPEFATALLDVLASCLHIQELLKDVDTAPEWAEMVTAEVRELSAALKQANKLSKARHWHEEDYAKATRAVRDEQERASQAAAAKMAKAREARQTTYDWEAVARIEKELSQAGRNQREWAAIIHKRLGVPPRTYRKYRTKKTAL